MKTINRLFLILTLLSVLFFACQKELSYELGTTSTSVGSLQKDAAGGCTGTVVFGTYYKDSVLNFTHFANINVNIDSIGSYLITTDTVQGYYFNASGSFATTGAQVVKLTGKGKPLSAGTHIFTLSYNGTFCEFSVNVIAASGGSAVFAPSCTAPVFNGTYSAGTAMTAGNTVTLNVTVTTIGTWSISTSPALNGVIFSGAGSFTSTGAQTITLTASGTPTASGTFNYPVAIGASSCNFACTFVGIPDYFPRTAFSNWSYEYNNVATDSLLVRVIPQTTVIAGNTYNIFIVTDNASLGYDTSGYYRRSGASYFEWGDISYGILDSPFRKENTFLKDNLTAGGTWSSSQFSGQYTPPTGGSPTTVTLRWDYSILQQNAAVTVKGTSYPNTIEVKQELKLINGPTETLQFYFRNYYARDKGLIKQDVYNSSNVLQYQMDVRRLVVY